MKRNHLESRDKNLSWRLKRQRGVLWVGVLLFEEIMIVNLKETGLQVLVVEEMVIDPKGSIAHTDVTK